MPVCTLLDDCDCVSHVSEAFSLTQIQLLIQPFTFLEVFFDTSVAAKNEAREVL